MAAPLRLQGSTLRLGKQPSDVTRASAFNSGRANCVALPALAEAESKPNCDGFLRRDYAREDVVQTAAKPAFQETQLPAISEKGCWKGTRGVKCHVAASTSCSTQGSSSFNAHALGAAAVIATAQEAARRAQARQLRTELIRVAPSRIDISCKAEYVGQQSAWVQCVGWRPPLSEEQEVEFCKDVQELRRLEKVRKDLEEVLRRAPADSEWAQSAKVSTLRLYAMIGKGRAAERKILQATSRLVCSIASRYQGIGLSLDDLCQEGARGVLHGARTFDASKGSRFSAHSYRWIVAMIGKAVKVKGRSTKLGPHLWRQNEAIKKAREAFVQLHLREPMLHEIAESTQIREQRVRVVLQCMQPIRHNNYLQLEDVSLLSNPWQVVEMQSQLADLQQALARLNVMERKVLQEKFGLEGRGAKSRAEVAKRLELCEGKVHTILKTARSTLRRALRPLWCLND